MKTRLIFILEQLQYPIIIFQIIVLLCFTVILVADSSEFGARIPNWKSPAKIASSVKNKEVLSPPTGISSFIGNIESKKHPKSKRRLKNRNSSSEEDIYNKRKNKNLSEIFPNLNFNSNNREIEIKDISNENNSNKVSNKNLEMFIKNTTNSLYSTRNENKFKKFENIFPSISSVLKSKNKNDIRNINKQTLNNKNQHKAHISRSSYHNVNKTIYQNNINNLEQFKTLPFSSGHTYLLKSGTSQPSNHSKESKTNTKREKITRFRNQGAEETPIITSLSEINTVVSSISNLNCSIMPSHCNLHRDHFSHSSDQINHLKSIRPSNSFNQTHPINIPQNSINISKNFYFNNHKYNPKQSDNLENKQKYIIENFDKVNKQFNLNSMMDSRPFALSNSSKSNYSNLKNKQTNIPYDQVVSSTAHILKSNNFSQLIPSNETSRNKTFNNLNPHFYRNNKINKKLNGIRRVTKTDNIRKSILGSTQQIIKNERRNKDNSGKI